MAIKYIKGSVFNTHCHVIAHGCNCKGGFGKGIAYTIAKMHPEVRVAYMTKYNSLHSWKLGDIQYVNVKSSTYHIIANCATQFSFLPHNVLHADYEAIKKIMIELHDFCKANNYGLAIPKIGAGLAGGDWSIIEKIIEEIFVSIDIYIYYIE